jgi:hypothetical protein
MEQTRSKYQDQTKNNYITIEMHTSTLTPQQRIMLIESLVPFHSPRFLAKLTDPQLHELWHIVAEYKNIYANQETSITKMYKEELNIDATGEIRS